MESAHEYKTYGQQWKDDLSAEGFKKNLGPLVPTVDELKAQGKICYNVIVKGPYHIVKFIGTKHE